ncbi:MAG TPA: 4-hydroxy-tetrahydrodipicolinate reductase [Bacteroidales bacterium]|nr:4-hydroxy-tetrahydrodipicolinate reductase [Bacteroidales bacterium]
MNIALSGYGRMGKLIAAQCKTRGHEVTLIIDQPEQWDSIPSNVPVDVIIDFSQPDAALGNIMRCLELGWPVVIGTTGWQQHLDEVKTLVADKDGALFHAPNFSIGMNMVFRLNRQLAWLVNRTGYALRIREVHHMHKADAPSGTAITLANDLIARVEGLESWQLGTSAPDGCIPIEAIREGEVNGIHEVIAESPVDMITLRHEAYSREGFAFGAVLAAEFIVGKQGVYTMEDLLGY